MPTPAATKPNTLTVAVTPAFTICPPKKLCLIEIKSGAHHRSIIPKIVQHGSEKYNCSYALK
jgi:hypothetical protein